MKAEFIIIGIVTHTYDNYVSIKVPQENTELFFDVLITEEMKYKLERNQLVQIKGSIHSLGIHLPRVHNITREHYYYPVLECTKLEVLS